jgi:integrase
MPARIRQLAIARESTKTIIQSTALKPLFLRTNSELEDAWVSSQSRWFDARWTLDDETPGQGKGHRTLKWNIEVADGEYLTDPEHAEMLDWLRRIVWSCFTSPARGDLAAPGSACSIFQGLKTVARWMIETKRRNPADLTSEASWEFVEELPDLMDADDDIELSRSQVIRCVRFFQRIWEQAPVIKIERAFTEPFDGRSVENVVARVTKRETGKIPPLQDEVAIPILNKATFFVQHAAHDICNLLHAYQAATPPKGGDSKYPQMLARQKVARAFKFSILPGATEPWHPRIDEQGRIAETVRRLVANLKAACVIVIQATTGMRISEICGMPFGMDTERGLPICIETRQTNEGLFELYLLRSKLSKTESTPRDAEWVVGLRPAFSGELPLAVRALIILNRIAELSGITAQNPSNPTVLAGLAHGRGFARSDDTLKNPFSQTVRRNLKNFVEDWVDLSCLPDQSRYAIESNDLIKWRESKGRIIKSHQFRKTFAQFTASIDARLVEAIQDQFKHVSLAMTMQGYLNTAQLAAISKGQYIRARQSIYAHMRRDAPLAGRMGEQIEQHIPADFKAEMQRLPPAEAWKKVVAWVDEREFKLFFAPHGKCNPLNPTNMRCHEVAGTTDWLPLPPNYQTRTPALCAGCKCFVVDEQHQDFWIQSYVEDSKALRCATTPDGYRAVIAYVNTARGLLNKLNVDVDGLDQRIDAELAQLEPKEMGNA